MAEHHKVERLREIPAVTDDDDEKVLGNNAHYIR
jgi:hypothetical protein